MNTLGELDQHRYMTLSTFRRSGAEVATPVWFAAAGGRLYVFTAGDSGKVKRLRHSSRARVAPSDARGRARRVAGRDRASGQRACGDRAGARGAAGEVRLADVAHRSVLAARRAHPAPRVDRDQRLNADTLEASGPVE